MNIRPKTKRRLVILAVGLLVLVGAGFGVYFKYVQQRNLRIANERAAAMKAYAAGDYAGALKDFSKYLDDTRAADWKPGQADTEALFAYGKSRASVELAGGRHLLEAKNIFEHYLRLKPADEPAETMLLDIYPRLNLNPEAVTLADDVLARRPDNVPALKAKTKALIQRGLQKKDPKDFADAIAAGEKLNAAAPDDVEGHLLTQLAAASAKQPPGDVIVKARKQVEDRPADPRYELVLASAHVYANDLTEAAKWLRTAAGRKAPDAKFVDELVIRLDALGMFRDSLAALERAAADLGEAEPSLTRRLAQRQWQAGQYEAVAKRLETLDPASDKSDATLLGLRALALYALKREPEAAALVDALERRAKGDSAAFAWSTALKARVGGGNLTPRDQVEKYRAALERDPGNAVVHYLRGEAYSKLGENTLALDAWNEAARRAPSWAAPRTRTASALAAEGRFADAVRAAEDAYKRSPNDLNIVIVWAQAAYDLLETAPGQKELERLARTVEDVQRAAPGEPNTLAIHAAVLARAGKAEAAAEVIRAALAADPPTPPAVLARLAAVSRDAELGLEDEIAKRLGEVVASPAAADAGPGAALVAAMERLEAGRARDGLDLLNAARAKAGAAGETVPWRLAVAQYLDGIGDASALTTWVQLADQNPKDLAVQSAALRARSRFQDRDFWRRTIDRVKQLTVENSQLWRLEDARWLLTAPDLTEQNQGAVLATLHELARNAPRSAEPRRLLAIAHERGAASPGASAQSREASLNSAVKAMQEACELRPGDVGMVADLSRLLRSAGRGDEVLKYLDRLATRPRLDPASRLRLAELYADHGQPRRSIEVAAPLGDDVAPRLARWHRALGETDAAAALYRKMLGDAGESGTAQPARAFDPQSALDAAMFFGARGEKDEAEKFLARLDALRLQPGARELVRAKYAERHAPDEAGKWYAAAAAAQGAAPAAWRELAGYHLRHRRFAESTAAVEAGLKQHAKDAELLAMKDRVRELEPLGDDAAVQPLFSFLSFDPRHAAAGEMLSILRAARDPSRKLEEIVFRLRAAADKHPNFLPLQTAAARGLVRLGEVQRAEQVARRAASAFPEDVDVVRLLAQVYSAAGKWADLRDTATLWRRLSPNDTVEADLLLARVQLNGDDAPGAAERLAPHAKPALADIQLDPESGEVRVEVLAVYARALIAQGKEGDAATALEPLAKRDMGWRRVWLDLAGAFGTRDLEAATAWVKRVEPLVPGDSPLERVHLAHAWYVVGREFDNRNSMGVARAIAESLTSDETVAAQAWTVMASADEGMGNLDASEREYRQALRLRPNHGDIRNNLAYVLLLKGDEASLREARDLAGQAIAAAPGVASYYDTLARVEAKLGNSDAAVTAFEKALSRDASSLEARIGLADVLARTNRRDEARQQLAQVEGVLRSSRPLPSPLAKQLEAVRSAVDSDVQSGRVE